MPHCNPFIALWIQRPLGRVTNPHNVPERRLWHLDLWFSCQICKITCSQTTPWGPHSCERWGVQVIPTRSALICAQIPVPSSCPFVTPSNFQRGSEGSSGVTPANFLLRARSEFIRGGFQRGHVPLTETTVVKGRLTFWGHCTALLSTKPSFTFFSTSQAPSSHSGFIVRSPHARVNDWVAGSPSGPIFPYVQIGSNQWLVENVNGH